MTGPAERSDPSRSASVARHAGPATTPTLDGDSRATAATAAAAETAGGTDRTCWVPSVLGRVPDAARCSRPPMRVTIS